MKEKILIKIKDIEELTKEDMTFINSCREREYGQEAVMDFKKDYSPSAKFFFVINNNKIIAFGTLRDISINYLDKKYDILGICNILSIEKGKGYGKVLIKNMIDFLKKKGKTGLGFTTKTDFFRKAGLKIEKDFIKRFIYKNPKTKEEIIDNEGDGIYYEGKDDFIKKVLSTKYPVYIDIIHW